MKNFNRYKKLEFAPVKTIQAAQNRLLKQHLKYCQKYSPFYKKLFKAAKIDPEMVHLGNLSRLPFTDKSDIARFNDRFLAVGQEEIEDIVLSSGTCGNPTKIAYNGWDLKRLAYNEAQSFTACGFTAQDRVLLTCTMDRCFVAGLAYYLGLRSIGAAAIRNGLNSLESHLALIKRLEPTAIVGVPSFIRKLGLFLNQQGCPAAKSKVRKIVCIGEPLRDSELDFLQVGKDLEKIWKAKAYSTYSSSEIVSTFCECRAQSGGHLHPELAVVEIIDDQGNPLPAKEIGEVVVTPLQIQAMPLVRFKTGDISFLIQEPCACKRNSLRLGPILGRKKQMMKVQGTTFYPQAIYSCLETIKGVTEYYIKAASAGRLADEIEVCASVNHPSCTRQLIQTRLQAHLRVTPKVTIYDEKTIRERVYPGSSRKPVRFFDSRTNA